MNLFGNVYLEPDVLLSEFEYRVIISEEYGKDVYHINRAGNKLLHSCGSVKDAFRDESVDTDQYFPWENIEHFFMDLYRKQNQLRNTQRFIIYADADAYSYIAYKWFKTILPNYDKDTVYDYINTTITFYKIKSRSNSYIKERVKNFNLEKADWDKLHQTNYFIENEMTNLNKWKEKNFLSIFPTFIIYTFITTGNREKEFQKIIKNRVERLLASLLIDVKDQLETGLLLNNQFMSKLNFKAFTLEEYNNIYNANTYPFNLFFGENTIFKLNAGFEEVRWDELTERDFLILEKIIRISDTSIQINDILKECFSIVRKNEQPSKEFFMKILNLEAGYVGSFFPKDNEKIFLLHSINSENINKTFIV